MTKDARQEESRARKMMFKTRGKRVLNFAPKNNNPRTVPNESINPGVNKFKGCQKIKPRPASPQALMALLGRPIRVLKRTALIMRVARRVGMLAPVQRQKKAMQGMVLRAALFRREKRSP